MAADLVGLLGQRGVGPVVAIGHSMGGQVVTALAAEYPARVHAVIVVDPAYGAAGDEVDRIPQRLADLRAAGADAAVRQMAGAFTSETPAWLKTWRVRQMLGAPQHVLAEAYAGMYLDPGAFGVRPASEAYLARVGCPTLALFSTPEPAAWMAAHLHHPLSTVRVWPGAGHYLHEERPDQFVALVDEWLEVIDGD
jgi:pimeloyl-ACP methyl ester carboxylesterase